MELSDTSFALSQFGDGLWKGHQRLTLPDLPHVSPLFP